MAAFAYTAVFTLMLASGQPIVSEEATYGTYDACMTESEASARQMAREWEFDRERTGLPSFFKSVEIRCEKREVKKHD